MAPSDPVESALRGWVESATRAREQRLDRAAARRFGVVHTPVEIAGWLARRADEEARALGLAGGLADPRAALIDPACGPGVFLACARVHARERTTEPGAFVGLDRDELALGDAAGLLEQVQAAAGGRRWGVRLLAADTPELAAIPGCDAALVPIVLGNPPWSTAARTRAPGAGAEPLLAPYRTLEGRPLGERRIGVLADAYVRFVRWAERLVERAGAGVLALALNSSFLDGPVHRGMRAHLARSFDTIELLDLGGNALTRAGGEPDAGRDENVFGVGVGVVLLVASRAHGAAGAIVRHARLRGAAASKLAVLERDARGRGPERSSALPAARTWTPAPAGAVWVPAPRGDPAFEARYRRWPALTELLPFHREGLQTNRDGLTIADSPEALLGQLGRFAAGEDDGEPWGRPRAHWDPARARRAAAELVVRASGGDGELPLARLLYRPLRERWVVLDPRLCHRPRPDLVAALTPAPLDAVRNVALLTCRKDRSGSPWRHAWVTRLPFDSSVLSTRSSARTQGFVAPEDAPLLAWGYAVLCSDLYRDAAGPLLASDWPRVPPPPDRVPAAADRLLRLHLDAGCTPLDLPGAPPRSGAPGRFWTIGHQRIALADERLEALLATTAATCLLLEPYVREAAGVRDPRPSGHIAAPFSAEGPRAR